MYEFKEQAVISFTINLTANGIFKFPYILKFLAGYINISVVVFDMIR